MPRVRRVKLVSLSPVILVALGVAAVIAASHGGGARADLSRFARPTNTSAWQFVKLHNKGADLHYCDGCTPPLTSSGGSVVDTSGASGFTITPVFWEPAGAASANQIPANYQS